MKKLRLVFWALARVAIVILLAAWGASHLRKWDRYMGFSLHTWSRTPGLILLIAGGLLVLICGAILGTRGILEKPGDRLFPKEFVASGPFRYVRNPMSLGIVVFMVGLGLYESSVSILLLALALFLALHLIVVYVEEPGLERRFGQSYLDYRRSVNRWLPKLDKNKP
jgi:protein-S-isoprenylcysteine O-methyltransferase Ste14